MAGIHPDHDHVSSASRSTEVPRAVYCEQSQEGGTLTMYSNRLLRDLPDPAGGITVLRSAVAAITEEEWHYRPTFAVGILLMAVVAAAGIYTAANQGTFPQNTQTPFVVEGIAFAISLALSLLRWHRWRYVLLSPSGHVWLQWNIVGAEPEWCRNLKQWVADTDLHRSTNPAGGG